MPSIGLIRSLGCIAERTVFTRKSVPDDPEYKNPFFLLHSSVRNRTIVFWKLLGNLNDQQSRMRTCIGEALEEIEAQLPCRLLIGRLAAQVNGRR